MKCQVSKVLLAGVVAGLTGLAGCAGSLSPLAIPELPDALARVLENESEFLAGVDSQLARVTPGTPIDDLGNLDGCWGSIWKDEANPGFVIAIVIHFDVENGTYTQWSVQDSAQFIRVIGISYGTFEILDEAHVALTSTEWYMNDPYTGELEQVPPSGETIAFTTLVTVDGDDMLLVLGVDDPGDLDPNDTSYYSYRRFDCPE